MSCHLHHSEPDYLVDDSAARKQADEGTVSLKTTAFAPAHHRDLGRLLLSPSTLPPHETPSNHKVHHSILQLPPLPPNVLQPSPHHALQPEDVSYFSRMRNVKQMQDLFMAKSYTSEWDMAAIDDMARRQLGFTHRISLLAEHQLRPVNIGDRSVYGNTHCEAYQCQFGRRDSRGRLICFNDSCSCHGEPDSVIRWTRLCGGTIPNNRAGSTTGWKRSRNGSKSGRCRWNWEAFGGIQ